MHAFLRLLASILVVLLAAPSEARPFRGSVPIVVILCQTADSGPAPQPVAHYRSLLLTPGSGGVADFWRDISYGGFNNAGSTIHGWYRLGRTTSQFSALGRFEKVDACLEAARTAPVGAVTPPANAIRYVVTAPAVDLFGWTGGAFLPWNFDVGAVVHEGGHGVGLDHTFSNDPNYRNADWAQVGEYDDPWDAMSWANSYRSPTPFGDAPAGLIGAHLDRMGWLPRTRLVTHGGDGAITATYTLAPLNNPGLPGALLLRIPYDPGDPYRYYTVEAMRRAGWASGIPATTVLIHDVVRSRDGAGNPTGPQIAWLQRNLGAPGRSPAQSLSANGVSISVVSLDAGTGQAVVRVTSDMARRCLVGWVWREAGPGDTVCVTGAERAETRQENALAASRRAGSGPYGPDTCVAGFVWREAFAGDRVCVTGASRDRARASNAAAASRANPARFVYGPNTCKPGFVWREADAFDWVCVTGATRAQVRADNAAAAGRWTSGAYGPRTCVQGFVWREAFPGDFVCVTGRTRADARADNAAAPARLAIP